MADRDVTVSLRAQVSGFVAGIKAAQAQVKGFNDDLQNSYRKRRALDELGTAAGIMGAAAAAGFGFAVKAAADFDSAMSNVEATGADARKNLDRLRDAAMKAGEATAFSATEAANGIENLLKAGVKAKDVIGGGLQGALDLAAAGELEVADAAELAATAMTQFNLQGKDVPHIADLLAAGAGKAQGEVSDLGMALKQGGLVASNMGLSIEETTGALSAFASAGLLGSDAGTSLKTMLLRLQNPSIKAKGLMRDLGFSAYDAKGNFIGLENLAGELTDSLKGMTQEQRDATLATLFGSDAVRAATVLYRQGEEGIAGWIKKVNDQGYAADAAATKLDNLKGDFEELTGALETALIGTGEGAQGPLRDLTQGLTDLIRTYNSMPEPVKKMVSAALLGGAVLGGGAFVATRLITGLAGMTENLHDLGIKSSATKVAIRGLAGTAGLGLLTASLQESNTKLSAFEGALGGALAGFSVAGGPGALVGGAVGFFGTLAIKAEDAADAIDGYERQQRQATDAMEEALSTMGQMTGAYTAQTREMVGSAIIAEDKFRSLRRLIQEGVRLDDLISLSLMDERLIKGSDEWKIALQATARSLSGLRNEGETWADFIRRVAVPNLERWVFGLRDSTEGLRRQHQQQRQVNAELSKGQKQLLKTAEAVDVDDKKTRHLAEALQAATDKTFNLTGKTRLSEEQLRDIAKQMGLTREQTQRLIEKYNQIPKDVRTDAIFDDDRARRDVDNFVKWTEKKWEKFKTVSPGFFGKDTVHIPGGSFAGGGLLTGPGTKTSDSIPLWGSRGEFMQQASAVDREGVSAMRALNEGRATIIPIQGLAKGGQPALALDGDTPAVKVLSNFAGLRDDFREYLKSLSFGGRVGAALKFARHERGDPYQLGGVGPHVYDCSGFMSAITNVLRGRPPHSRVGSTGTFPWPGFARGPGVFTIGSTTQYPGSGLGHMAGTLAGVNVESSGGIGVRVGPSARGWRDPGFNQVYHLAGVKLTSSGGGGDTGALGKFEKLLIRKESSFRVNANNPTSSGFGLGQLLEANRIHYARKLGFNAAIERGDTGTTDRDKQIAMFRAYVDDRYGGADKAWAFHQRHGYYDRGGLLPPGVTMAVNRTGKNEHVLTDEQYRSRRNSRPIYVTLDVDGRQIGGVIRDINREEMAEEFRYMGSRV